MDKKINFVQGMYPEDIHFNMMQESVESADKRIAKATAGKGIVSGFDFRIVNNTAFITSGEAFDELGRQVHHTGDDLEIDLSGITRPDPGNWKWISFYVSFAANASEDVYDDSNVRHDLYLEESVSAHYIAGEEGSEESVERPDIGDNILVAEILIDSSSPFESFTPYIARRSTVVSSFDIKTIINDLIARDSPFIAKKDPFLYDNNTIVVRKDSILNTLPRWRKSFSTDVELSENDLDTSDFEVGNDYYIHYIYQNGTGKLIISLNNTCENGAVIGGFHYGHIRKVSDDGLWIPINESSTKWGTNWANNVVIGIVPNSVWDLKNRPKCNPEGMAKIGKIWIDIYAVSKAESIRFIPNQNRIRSGKLQSKYGKKPVTGAEISYYNFVELAMGLKKRLPRYSEIITAYYGSPHGKDDSNDYGYTDTTNNSYTFTGCDVNPETGIYDPVNGVKPFAISASNIVDPVGNVRCLTSDLTANPELEGGWNWWNMSGDNLGDYYSPNPLGLLVIAAGSNFIDGVHGGARTTYLQAIMELHGQFGCRFVCDAL